MLTISPETFKVASENHMNAYVAKLATLLRETVPGLTAEPPQQLNAQIRLQIDAARGFALTSEQAIGSYVMTAAQLGPDFVDHFPAARAILTSRIDEAEKAEQLEKFTIALFQALGR